MTLETPALMAADTAGRCRSLRLTAPVADVDSRIRRVADGHLVIADLAIDTLIDVLLVLARRLAPHVDDLSDDLAGIIIDLDAEAIAVDDLDHDDVTFGAASTSAARRYRPAHNDKTPVTCTVTGGFVFHLSGYIKLELDHVTVGHDVVLALLANLAVGASLRHGARLIQVLEGHDLGLNEAALEVRVDHARRLRGGGTLLDRPRAGLLRASRQVRLQPQGLEARLGQRL